MTAPKGRPPDPEDGTGPACHGAGPGESDTWRDIQPKDMAFVPDPVMVGGLLLQFRSRADWTPARGMANRRAAALRLPPLPSGHRDPDGPRSDAPDRHYQRHTELWDLAAQLADPADDQAEAR